MSLWGLLWVQRGRFANEHLIYGDNCLPAMFRTRQEARAWAIRHYGFIRDRADLRAPPHEWRMPRPVRVAVKWSAA